MLASHNTHLQSSRLFPASSPSTSSSPTFTSHTRNSKNRLHSSAASSPASESNAKLQQHYFDLNSSSSVAGAAPVVLDTSNIPINNIELYMPNSVDFQSTHSRAFPYASSDEADLSMWQLNGGNSGVANQLGSMIRGQNHQRMPSSSSIGSTTSAATASPFQGPPRNLRAPDQQSSKQDNTQHYRRMSARGHLPSPAPTPTRNTFLSPTSSSFNQQEMMPALAASLGLNQALDDDMSQMTHSNRVSFSSIGQGPATPMTTIADDERQRLMISNDNLSSTMINNSLPDLYYAQNMSTSQQANPNFLMPHAGSVNERLLEAQMARSQSSGSNQSVPRSPMKYQTSPQTESEPKTISPKDAVLEYNPTSSDFPLFGQTNYGSVSQQRQQQFQQPVMSNVSQAWQSSLQAMSASQMPSYTTFATPSLPSSMSMSSMNGFIGSASNPRRTISRQQTDQNPEFPAQLTSMESSASEAAPPSSGGSTNLAMSIPKPEATTADTGTYSCTYHGCLQRFSTPQKLQKHKRDVHRNNPHVTPGVGSGMSTAQLMERNSQSGPHKCERINPTTGKVCNAIFSRPYDLTRHEDTIHNARKQKVRCAICTEEKMFSRSDALTRHMRVVHPEVDFPGKHRKRGSRD